MKENANDFVRELLDESRRHYLALTPEQRREVDIRQACAIIRGIGFADNIPPRVEEMYRKWFIENCDREHVQAAMERLFNDYCQEMEMTDYQQ